VSLINQVLKDIDRRNPNQVGATPAYRHTQGHQQGISATAVAVLVIGLALIALTAFFSFKYEINVQALTSFFQSAPAQPEPITQAALPEQPESTVSVKPAVSAAVSATVVTAASRYDRLWGTSASAIQDARAQSALAENTKQPAAPKPAAATAPAAPAAPPASSLAPQPKPITKTVRGDQQAQNFYAQAQQAIAQRNPEKARAFLRQAIDTYPAHHQSRLLLARLLLEQRQPDAAHQLMAQGLLLAPGNEEFILMQAHGAMLGSDIDTAISILQGSLQISPRSGDYHAFLGTLLQRKNRHPEAIAQFTAALRQSPRNAEWLVGIGISMQNEKMTLAATQAFQQAIDLGTLTPSLTAFAQQQLAVLSRQR
jgi:MSHA biogenesis protein MshN